VSTQPVSTQRVSTLASYHRLLHLAGPCYVLVAFLGRLPLAMSQIGTLLLVAGSTGRYAAGGLAAGMLAVANAVCSPAAGALADRWGQRPVVLVQSLVGGVGLASLVALAGSGSDAPALAGVAAFTGAFLPQVGPLARVRWRPLVRSTGPDRARLLETAFSYEGAADEASFVLGPALLGVLAAVAGPGAALLVAAATLLVFGCAFALHPSAVRSAEHDVRGTGGRLVTPTLAVLMTAQLLVGAVFGSVQTGTGVLATAEGEAGLAGLVHAVLGVGSAVAGLAVAALPRSFGHAARLLVFAVGLCVLSAPLLATGSLTWLTAVVFVLGFTVGPFMIGIFTMAERTAPPSRLAAALTLLAGATGIGYAVGSGVAGRLADASGHTAAFAVTVSAASCAVVLAVAAQPLLRRLEPPRQASSAPTPSTTITSAVNAASSGTTQRT
jgi:MFS family permease